MSFYLTNYFIVFLILSSFSFEAYAKNKIDAQIHDIPPWGFVNEKTGNVEGIYIDIIKELQKRTDIQFNIMAIPLKRVTRSLSTGETDFSILFERNDFKDVVVNLGPVMKMNIYLIRKEGALDYNRMLITRGEEEIADKIIEYLDLKGIVKDYTLDHPTNILLLKNNRADLAILVGDDLLSDVDHKLPGFICEVIEVKSAFAFIHEESKFNKPEITDKIINTLDNMWKDGFIKKNNARAFNTTAKCLIKNRIAPEL
ncbi:substrate-binding periplasmic protein [Shewanella sp. YLB-07]|uniref:substrate-binding periplasmic protein n=1 Tax=Shewanella sp. YLB-07 TaxID=2601268 RepID=UPI00128C7440|nr:transporter substrate-binding domain-containing protein [Shewanella sp. YLB-07]MPY24467.1 ABC transporter substrate-binding protein [Shewanella sp. YLB-07]